MKRSKVLCVFMVVLALFISSATASAQNFTNNPPPKEEKRHSLKLSSEEVIEKLEKKRAQIQQDLKDGKIDKEKAERNILKLDQMIQEAKNFNKLTIPQKKEKLLKDFTTRMNKEVKDGCLTQVQAEHKVADFKAELEKWDGQGYPDLKGLLDYKCKKGNKVIINKRLENALNQAVKDGKITQKQKEDILKYLPKLK